MYGMTNAGGGGSGSFKKTATGSLSPAAEFTVSDLSFRPRIVILYGEYNSSKSHSTYVCVGLFEKNGDLLLWRPSYYSEKNEINPEFDTVNVSDNGFSVTFGNLSGASRKWPTLSSGATVTYICYG